MEEEKSGRLREHPTQRFAAPQHQFDLRAEAAALRQELQAGEGGHRQKSLYKRGSTSVSLFLFGHMTRLPSHRAKGVVYVQVLSGHIRITAEGESHDLPGGGLLVLAPGVEHDLVAHEVSEVLLTVHLDAQAGAPPV